MDIAPVPKDAPQNLIDIPAAKPPLIPHRGDYQVIKESEPIPALVDTLNMDSFSKPQYLETNGKILATTWPSWNPVRPHRKENTRFNIEVLDIKNGLKRQVVQSLLEDHFGRIWIPGKGCSLWDGNGLTHFSKNNGMSFEHVRSLLEDREGRIWIGSGGRKGEGRINVYDGEKLIQFGENDGFDSPFINALLEDQQGQIWIGMRIGLKVWGRAWI